MKKIIFGLLALLVLGSTVGDAQQTLPANTVVGRLGIGPGPSQAIPFASLKAAMRLPTTVTDSPFNADPTGVNDSTAAFASAIAAAPTQGCDIYIPVGTYKLNLSSGAIPVNRACVIRGAGDGTILSVNHATNNVFNVTGQFSSFYNFKVTNAVTRTAGSYIFADTPNVLIRDVRMFGGYRGITFTPNATLSIVDSVEMREFTSHATSANSAGIFVGATGTLAFPSSVRIDKFTMDNGGPNYPRAGIYVQSADALVITNAEVLHCQFCLLMEANAGSSIFATKIDHSYFDQGQLGAGILTTNGNGQIVRTWVSNTWFASITGVTNTFALDNTGGTGTTTGFECHNCQFVNGTNGVLINNAAWSDIKFIGGIAAGNSVNGILASTTVNDLLITGMSLGSQNGFTANPIGINLTGGASNRNRIINNNFQGTATPISFGSPFSGTENLVFANIGIAVVQSDNTALTGARNSLGLGTAATQNTGTSGGTIPFLNGTNAWSAPNTFSQTNTGTANNSLVTSSLTRGTTVGTGGIFSGFELDINDAGSTAALSLQSFRLSYTNNNTGGTGSSAFDAGVSVESVFNQSMTSQFRGLSISGPSVAAAKTLATYTGAYFSAKSGAGTVTNNFAIQVEAGGGQIKSSETTAATSSTTGTIVTSGGLGVAGAIYGGAEITTGLTVVNSLPACNAARKGARWFVTDNNTALAFAAVVTTGGAIQTPVYCDGTTWRQG